MDLLAALFGFLLVAIGALGAVSPPRLITTVGRFQSQRGLYLAAALRLTFGAVLLASAATSRSPAFLYVLGGLAFVAGIMTPFFGLQRFEALLDWWSSQPPVLLRAWCAVVLALGAAVVGAVIG